MDFMKGCQLFLLNNVTNMVVKFNKEAKKYETIESKRASDKYVSARMKTDSTITYDEYSEEVIRKAATENLWNLTEKEILLYRQNKNNIPMARQDILVSYAREEYIASYVELNDYYRMLNGQPPLGIDDIFLDDVVYESYGIEKTPFHKLSQYILNSMDETGFLKKLLNKYPDYKFIKYAGLKKVDLLTARMADNFDILYIPSSENYSNYRDYLIYYDQTQAYMMSVVYNMYLSSKYDLYDNYIAFVISVMAMNRLIANTMVLSVTRDFYDETSMRILLEAYGIPYTNVFSIYQNKLITKNLNILLMKKSTNQALIDIMDLLGFDEFHLIKYYLIKQHKMDNNGNPLFKYVTYKDDDGNDQFLLDDNGEKIYDYEKMYDFYFNGIDIGNHDTQEALTSTMYRVDYDEMTYDDDRWITDKEVKDKLLTSEFNYIETKYMDVSIIYKMHKIIFETVYLSRMILDKSKNTKFITISLGKITSQEVSLFDTIVTLIVLLCKYYGMSSDILNTPSKVLYILGFNFEADFDNIRKEIEAHPELYYDDLTSYIHDIDFTTVKSINDMYVNVRDLESLLVSGMNRTETLEAYTAYKKLYKTLLFMKNNNELYRMSNGKVAETFDEYLNHENSSFYKLIQDDDKEKISNNIKYITSRLSSVFTDTKYLGYIRIIDADAINALLKLLRFFQSYTLDLRNSKLTLLIDSRYHNMAHFITKIQQMKETMHVNDMTNQHIDALINNIIESIKMRGILKTYDRLMYMTEDLHMNGYIVSEDELYKFEENIYINDKTNYNLAEYIKGIVVSMNMQDKFTIKDTVKFIETLFYKDDINSKDKITKVSETLKMNDNQNVLTDGLKQMITLMTLTNENLLTKGVIIMNEFVNMEENINSKDCITKTSESLRIDNHSYENDGINEMSETMRIKDGVSIRESITFIQ